jgi:hypothetical protein
MRSNGARGRIEDAGRETTDRFRLRASAIWNFLRHLLSLVEREAYLDRHLPMPDFVILDVAAGLQNLEPPKVSQALRGLGKGILNGIFNSDGGRADKFDLLVDMIAHPRRLGFPPGEDQPETLPCLDWPMWKPPPTTFSGKNQPPALPFRDVG